MRFQPMRKWKIKQVGPRTLAFGPTPLDEVEVIELEHYQEVLLRANELAVALKSIAGDDVNLKFFKKLPASELKKIVFSDTRTARFALKDYVKWLEEKRKESKNVKE